MDVSRVFLGRRRQGGCDPPHGDERGDADGKSATLPIVSSPRTGLGWSCRRFSAPLKQQKRVLDQPRPGRGEEDTGTMSRTLRPQTTLAKVQKHYMSYKHGESALPALTLQKVPFQSRRQDLFLRHACPRIVERIPRVHKAARVPPVIPSEASNIQHTRTRTSRIRNGPQPNEKDPHRKTQILMFSWARIGAVVMPDGAPSAWAERVGAILSDLECTHSCNRQRAAGPRRIVSKPRPGHRARAK